MIQKPMLLFAVSIAVSSAQTEKSKLVLVPSAPMSEMTVPEAALRSGVKVIQPEIEATGNRTVRPAILQLKPAGDPIYLVEEPGQDQAAQWRTYQRPKVEQFSRNGEGVALQGYDVISYLERHPSKGNKKFVEKYGGVDWYFANEEHQNLFAQDPKRYVPKFGGFCAYSVSRGYAATANPEAYSIDDGNLFLFFNGAVKHVWDQNKEAGLKAERNWPKLHL